MAKRKIAALNPFRRFKKQPDSAYSKRRAGFTLVEVSIAMSLATALSIAVMKLFISVGEINFDSTAKLQINNDVRGFTSELTESARSATEFNLFTAVNNLTVRESGQTGDLFVLVWADPLPLEEVVSGDDITYYVRRIIAFARVVDDEVNNTGPVIRYERTYPAAGEQGALKSDKMDIPSQTELMLANEDGKTTSRQVIELSRGLATQKLFYYSKTGRSITVNGEIFHGNDARRVTNTYNFTVNPRG